MAGIEKVCEWGKEGHWKYGDYPEGVLTWDSLWEHCTIDPDWVDPEPTNPSFMHYGRNGMSIYRDNVTLCLYHREEFRKAVKGRKHLIEVQPFTYEWHDNWYREGWVPKDHRDFWLTIEGFSTGYQDNHFKEVLTGRPQVLKGPHLMRWFSDFRRFKKNMKSLLGVHHLNIKIRPATVVPDDKIWLMTRRGAHTRIIQPAVKEGNNS